MFKIRKKVISIIGFMLMFCLLQPMSALAAGTTTIHISNDSPAVGDGVSVDIVASESDSIGVKYNDGVLRLTGSSVEYTTDGNTIHFQGTNASFQFEAIASGKSSIIVSGASVTGSSAAIQVGGEANEPTEEQPANNTNDVQDGQFTVDGVAYVVSERFSEEEIPGGFEKTRVTIDGYDYKALSNGTITLIYLKPAADTSGKGVFYVYDAGANQVSTFAMLGSGQNAILLATPEKMLLDGMQPKEVTVDERKLNLYSVGNGEGFYFAYGTNQNGVTGWFQYDATDGSVQRVNEQLLQMTVSQDDESQGNYQKDAYYDKWAKQRYLLAALLFVVVVLLVVVINLLLGRRKNRDDDFDDDDVEEEAYDEEDAEENEIMELQKEVTTETIEEVVDTVVSEAQKTVEAQTEDTFAYKDVKGTEVFRSSKEVRHKSNADAQLDIMDLNDL